MASYRLSDETKIDFLEIANFDLRNVDKSTVAQHLVSIRNDLKKLAGSPFLGESVEGMAGSFQKWYIVGMKYEVYLCELVQN